MVTVGTALMEIRENRLYRSEFKTFEEYCQSKWGFTRNFAHMQIQSAEIASGLLTTVNIPNEKTAEQFVKVFCADHPQVSVCPKSPPQSPTADRLARCGQSVMVLANNRLKRKHGPVWIT